ncbi:MAG: amylo-alpha-1,6-glucosidase [Candidatus Altiarchaeota archaeon]
MRINPSRLGFDRAVGLEWVLTNGLGGYSSSTVLGLNTRKYHGLLVASVDGLKRIVCLQKMDDSMIIGNRLVELNYTEFGGGYLQKDGVETLVDFDRGLDGVCFVYETSDFRLEKRVSMPFGKNALIVYYSAVNKTGEVIKHVVKPHITCRGIHELLREGSIQFNTQISGKRASVSLGGRQLNFKAYDGSFSQEAVWMRNVYYRLEAERGYEALEDSYIPLRLSLDLKPGSRREYQIVVWLDDSIVSDDEVLKICSLYDEDPMVMVLNLAKSFIVDVNGRKTVIAGYHWFGEWGRDAMISLPGLTLVNGRIEDAKMILERFLEGIKDGRIMTESDGGSPAYRDFDSTLWLVDRVMQYVKYAGANKGIEFLKAQWSRIVDIMQFYQSIERDGLIPNKGGTWMDTLERSGAVEVQALWYNALKVCKRLSEFSGLDPAVPIERLTKKFESNFMKAYWNGNYLRDCAGEDSFRPNQIMALSLEYPCVGADESRLILNRVDELLLTPFGLRTLSPKDGRYKGSYSGGVVERDASYHNGTVWPWLLGPYASAVVLHRGVKEKDGVKALLDNFFRKALNVNALGSINEIFDGDSPHRPRGCISQAWSVAEPLRAYFEDALGKKPLKGLT